MEASLFEQVSMIGSEVELDPTELILPAQASLNNWHLEEEPKFEFEFKTKSKFKFESSFESKSKSSFESSLSLNLNHLFLSA